jgi:hypothetical protein
VSSFSSSQNLRTGELLFEFLKKYSNVYQQYAINNQQSILSCLKKGSGVDVRRAIEYFSCLDSDKEHHSDVHHPRLVRTQSSSLLDVLSTPSSSVDPQWVFSRIEAMETESRDRVNSFLNSVVESDEPKQKKNATKERCCLK